MPDCGEQAADGGVPGERVGPGQAAGDEAAEAAGGSDERGETGGDLNFCEFMRAQEGEAGRIRLHDGGEVVDGGDGHLREGPRGAPEPDSFRVSPLTEERGELRGELGVGDPHGTSRSATRGYAAILMPIFVAASDGRGNGSVSLLALCGWGVQ